jgi:hypothetical protein
LPGRPDSDRSPSLRSSGRSGRGRSPSPTGVVGLTTTASSPSRAAASTIRSASSLVRLYGTDSSHGGGASSSVAGRPGTGPQVPAVEVCRKRRTPSSRQSSTTVLVPSTLTRSCSATGAS